METIFPKPYNIITFEGKHLFGVIKTVVNLQLDIITFYIENREYVEKNKLYTIVNIGTVETGFLKFK
jgi:hypothetical protein